MLMHLFADLILLTGPQLWGKNIDCVFKILMVKIKAIEFKSERCLSDIYEHFFFNLFNVKSCDAR